jgi:hypothetical protein
MAVEDSLKNLKNVSDMNGPFLSLYECMGKYATMGYNHTNGG